ncbi:Dcm Site-specific DNA methylase [uncultured Caudovirales phage]|uniref:Cytosine-specific methyltransferase n=1 Tax=uncultured Caudovirales phage TaxID=2100421 RepID=A0A6J5KHU6_9CAUD|nr:Dcm Site-specific DNA methylase [uncultured Caudovirales phage]
MKFLSVCSGIEAASVAWHPLGWESVAYSEIEPFPCQVLKHHYPNVPNLGDMTKFKEWPDADVDVFVGGTPCQSFSVAGLRKGLDDPRGNLMLTYLAIAKRYRPNWLVWENVPGVLSSAKGRDFGSFLGGLAILGYGFAYRVLDAQYFGVAQRRKRVFVVGYLGNWRPAAAVLFERHSLQGHPAPRRQTGQRIAPSVTTGPSFSRTGNDRVEAEAMVATVRMVAFGEYSDDGSASAMKARDYKDATDLVMQPIAIGTDCYNGSVTGDVAATMGTPGSSVNASGPTVMQPIALAENTIGRKPENGGNGLGFTDGGPMYTLNATGVHGVAQPMAFDWQSGGDARGLDPKPTAQLQSCQTPAVLQQMAVRRLTPVECERLQGFPDRYTDIQPKGKPTPDGPRYKALGNSMAVPVMAWIGKRIQMVDDVMKEKI